jgi:hypothetical protein
MPSFAFSSRIPRLHVYRDSNGRPQSFKPDKCEVYNVHELTSHGSVSDERTALIARTLLGVWLEGKIVGIGPAHPSLDTNPEATHGAPEAPFWEQFIIRWEEVGTIGAVDLFDDFAREYPLSLVEDIERSMRSQRRRASPTLDSQPIGSAAAATLEGENEPLATLAPPRQEDGQPVATTSGTTDPERLNEAPQADGPATTLREDEKGHLAPIPPTEEALALELRRVCKPTEAALVEFMTNRKNATTLEVGQSVHDDETASDKTIRSNCNRTNEDAERLGSPYRYRLSAGVVFKTS